jgi:hypothetical protein
MVVGRHIRLGHALILISKSKPRLPKQSGKDVRFGNGPNFKCTRDVIYCKASGKPLISEKSPIVKFTRHVKYRKPVERLIFGHSQIPKNSKECNPCNTSSFNGSRFSQLLINNLLSTNGLIVSIGSDLSLE